MTQPLSPARCGASNGLRFAAYVGAIYLTSVVSAMLPVVQLLTFMLIIGAPAVIYLLLANDMRRSGNTWTAGALWLDGLICVIGGAAIGGAALLAYLQWIDPTFLSSQWDIAIATLDASGDPASQQLADDFRRAIDNGFSISPTMFVMSLIWLATLTGSIMSFIVATIVRLRAPRAGTTPPRPE